METDLSQEIMDGIIAKLQEAERFEDCMWEIEGELLDAIGAERFTIYQLDSNGHEIVAWYRTSHDAVQEIRLPLTPASIAGYVAMSRAPLIVDDVYDSEYLESIHPDLVFDHAYDQQSGFLTEAMILVPIIHRDKLYGVLQMINNVDGGAFSDEAYYKTVSVGEVIAEKFRYELKTEIGPFDQLLQTGKISIDKFEEVEEKAKEEKLPLSHLLKNQCDISTEALGEALSNFYQVPFHAYDEAYIIEPDILENLNKQFLASNYWVPLYNDGDKATILIADPNNHDLILDIQSIVKAAYHDFNVGLEEDILHYLGLSITGDARREAAKIDDISDLTDVGDIEAVLHDDGDDLTETSDDDSKVVQLVNKIILKAVQEDSSDIHIEPMYNNKPGIVRMRVDGSCREVFQIPPSLMRPVISRIKILSGLDIAERRKPQDGKMALKMGGKPLELRIATLPVVPGESAVMRILAQGDALPFDKLALSERNASEVKRMIHIPYGLFLVVGPTGSGKTTTLHAILALLNTEDRKVLTAEDPVEITQDGLQQVQVLPRAGLTFAIALRAFLRCDPDVILIGEMRDEETAGAGVEASLTGHMVFSTLHTNSAPETVVRLLDIGLDPMNFADALVGILAQRLVRTLCGKCKEPYIAPEEEWDKLKHYYGEQYWDELNIDITTHELYRPVGCDRCSGTGYRGRMGVHEVLDSSVPMKKLIARAAEVAELRELAMSEGMRTLVQDGVAKIIAGYTDMVQLRRVAAT